MRPIHQYERAADLVAELYSGKPVTAAEIARRLGMPDADGDPSRALKLAAARGFPIRRVGRSGWEPAAISEEEGV